MSNAATTIYTIGHSNHTWERFVDLLKPHQIELLVDVRAYPFSRFAPWSNREKLSSGLIDKGIEYLWMGERLGGMKRGPRRTSNLNAKSVEEWYRTRTTEPDFLAAIAEVSQLATQKRLALMCSEGEPARCHRTMLLAPAFPKPEFDILHILPKSKGAAIPMSLIQ